MTATITGPPQPPEPPQRSDAEVAAPQRHLIFIAVLLAALDQTIVATVLPTVVADLGGAGHQSWVVTSYMAPWRSGGSRRAAFWANQSPHQRGNNSIA